MPNDDRADSKLVEATLAGDTEAFGALVDRYRHQVYGLCMHHLGDFEAAEDAAQAAFVRAYERLSQLREASSFASWLRNIATNVCRMRWRQVSREVALSDADDAASDDDSDRLAVRATVRQAIASLPAPTRMAVNLFYIDGLSHQEVGSFLGVTAKSVDSRLHRARQHLQKEMMGMVECTYEEHHLTEEFVDQVLLKVSVEGIGMDANSKTLMLLRREDGKAVPIWIDASQSVSIAMELEKRAPPRPMTHDLLRRVMREFGIRLTQVVLDKPSRRFQCQATLRHRDEGEKTFDLPPGDGVAMALRSKAPVLFTEEAWEGTRKFGKPDPTKDEKPRQPNPWALALSELRQSGSLPEPEPPRPRAEALDTFNPCRAQRMASWETDLRPVTIEAVVQDGHGRATIQLSDGGGSDLFIWTGPAESCAIGRRLKPQQLAHAGEEVQKARRSRTPDTHDLVHNVLAAFGVELHRIVIDYFGNDTYLAYADLRRKRTARLVDARPSDCMALALRAGCPLFIHDEVWSQAAGQFTLDEVLRPKAKGEEPERLSRPLSLAPLLELGMVDKAACLVLNCNRRDNSVVIRTHAGDGTTIERIGEGARTSLQQLMDTCGISRQARYPKSGSSVQAGTTQTADLRVKLTMRGNTVTASVQVARAE